MKNETIENILKRRSIKKYQSKMPSMEDIEKIIECGTYAASGMNRQSAIILCVTNKEKRNQLSKLNAKVLGNENIDPFYGAPVVFVVLADKRIPTYQNDGSLVMANLMLAAKSLGLGSCWIHRAKEMFETKEGKEILQSLGIEDYYEGIGNCILGYADENPKEKPRKENYVYVIE